MQANPLVKIQDVSFQYPGKDTNVLNGASLTIDEGDFLAIIGGNGSGKSTLCKSINGLVPHFYVGEFSGEVIVDGLNTTEHTVATLSKTIGYVYQDFDNQLLRPTVRDDVSFVPLNYGLNDYLERGEWALRVAGISHLANEFVWQLSGGQKHLLALAGAIAMKPKLLIVDEPIAQLDPKHAKQIYDVLKTLNEEHGITIITIEHHTEFIADYCKKVVLMDQGQVVWKKPVREALCSVEELVSKQIYPPQVTMAAYYLQRRSSMPITLNEAVTVFDKLELHSTAPLSKVQTEEKQSVLSLQNIEVKYQTVRKKNKLALKNITTTFNKGDQIALVGNNGSGKSTLLKVVAGIVKPSQGEIQFSNLDIKKVTPETVSNHVAYVFQNAEEMFIDDCVRKEIEFYLKARKIKEIDSIVDEILKDFDLVELQDMDARLLSGGQQRRVSLAIGAAMSPSVIILDEPTTNLDIATKNQVVKMLERLKKHVDTIIIATHDMQLVAEWATRTIVMHSGELLADTRVEDLFAREELLEKAGLVPPQIINLCNYLGIPPCTSVEKFVELYNQEEQRGVLYGIK